MMAIVRRSGEIQVVKQTHGRSADGERQRRARPVPTEPVGGVVSLPCRGCREDHPIRRSKLLAKAERAWSDADAGRPVERVNGVLTLYV